MPPPQDHQNGLMQSLAPFILTSLQTMERSVGAVNGNLSAFKDEAINRIKDLEDTVQGIKESRAQEKAQSAPSTISSWWNQIPLKHRAILAGLLILAMSGHLSPAEIKAILLSAVGVKH